MYLFIVTLWRVMPSMFSFVKFEVLNGWLDSLCRLLSCALLAVHSPVFIILNKAGTLILCYKSHIIYP